MSRLQVVPKYNTWAKRAEVNAMNFAQLRDALLAADPLSVSHVAAVNQAEAAFWRNNQVLQIFNRGDTIPQGFQYGPSNSTGTQSFQFGGGRGVPRTPHSCSPPHSYVI